MMTEPTPQIGQIIQYQSGSFNVTTETRTYTPVPFLVVSVEELPNEFGPYSFEDNDGHVGFFSCLVSGWAFGNGWMEYRTDILFTDYVPEPGACNW